MAKLTKKRREFVKLAKAKGLGPVVTRKALLEFSEANGVAHPYWLENDATLRAERGSYTIPHYDEDLDTVDEKVAATEATLKKKSAKKGKKKSAKKTKVEAVVEDVPDLEVNEDALDEALELALTDAK